jgi:hypothetical protein
MDTRDSGSLYTDGQRSGPLPVPAPRAPGTLPAQVSGPPVSGTPVSPDPGTGPAPTQPIYGTPVSGGPPTYNPAQAPGPGRGYGAGQTPGTPSPYEATQIFPATQVHGAPAPAFSTPRIHAAQVYGEPAGHVPLAQKRWLLPAAIGVLVAGLLAGGVMAAFALPSGGAKATPTAARPLPGDLTDPSQPPAQTPTADPTPTPTAAPTTPPSHVVPPTSTLRTASSQCLTVDGNDDRARTHAATCDGSIPQRWLLNPLRADTYMIVDTASGKCLDVNGASKDDGAQIQLYTCNGTNAQQWTVAWQGNAFALVSVNSGKCAAIEGDGGTKQRDCRDDTSQRWTVQAG